MTPKILKASAKIVGPSLLEFMNISLYSGHFPDALKIAKIIPIHKGGPNKTPEITDSSQFCQCYQNF